MLRQPSKVTDFKDKISNHQKVEEKNSCYSQINAILAVKEQ